MSEEIVVISVGGSLIAPDEIDLEFLESFKKLILSQNKRFAIVVGGGKTARTYQEGAKKLGINDNETLDWLGIYATYINAKLVQEAFGKDAHSELITKEPETISFNEKILVSSGWEPGKSTDYDTVIIAKKLGAKKLVNLSNIDYAYDKDPKKHSDAKPIEETTWPEFRKLLPKDWSPGLNSPFDPVAAEIAEENNIEVAIMGKDMDNLKNYLEGKEFVGTIVR